MAARSKPPSRTRLNQRAVGVVAVLDGMDANSALTVLTLAMQSILASSAGASAAGETRQPRVGELLRRRRGRCSRVEADAPLQTYIHSLNGYRTIDQIVKACRKRFGAVRTPSRSSIGRYLRSLAGKQSRNRRDRS